MHFLLQPGQKRSPCLAVHSSQRSFRLSGCREGIPSKWSRFPLQLRSKLRQRGNFRVFCREFLQPGKGLLLKLLQWLLKRTPCSFLSLPNLFPGFLLDLVQSFFGCNPMVFDPRTEFPVATVLLLPCEPLLALVSFMRSGCGVPLRLRNLFHVDQHRHMLLPR